jgi:hypothetical protein
MLLIAEGMGMEEENKAPILTSSRMSAGYEEEEGMPNRVECQHLHRKLLDDWKQIQQKTCEACSMAAI